ncbi:RagB/SusD family nutrient uptake outer membrane protein [Gaetbulibacter sp. M240]|uniref:RagB/SusD family nutrient uptake outer membrane protein n=1 Tax=Gaetbulibacter sp. M240 TaxID=3126511 RepID=UPI00374F4AF6
MKNKIYILYFLTLFAAFQSCDDTLEELPETYYNEDQIFSSEDGVETAINGLYQSFADPGYHGSSWHGLIAPHSGKFWSNQGASSDATSLNCSPINTWLTRLWPQMYQTINVANVIINNLENTGADLANKESALGQAYFMRGVVYFDLVRLFGGVPIKTKPATAESLHTPRASKQEVYDLIISDLEKAKTMMPGIGVNVPGRPANLAAYVYLAKVYVQLAGEDGGDPSYWQKAYDEIIPVYGMYSLTPTYAELVEQGNENTVESIFEIQYAQNGATRNSDIIRMYTPQNSAYVSTDQRTFGRIRPNKETFDQHVAQYPDDPRIDATFIYDFYLLRDGSEQITYPAKDRGNDGYPYIRKYLDFNYNGTTTSRNFIVLRYADVLLTLAEIENELNGPSNAYTYVNEVLARARNTSSGNATEPADWSGMTQDEFRMRIMRERQYELLAEGHEWFDVRRRGYEYFLEEVVEPHNSNPTFDTRKDYMYPVSVKNMLLPIPSTEISGNQAITQADQNPGY